MEEIEKIYLQRIFKKSFPVLNFTFFVIRKSNLNNNKANPKIELEPISENFAYTQSFNIKAKWTYSAKNDLVEGYNGKISDNQKMLIKTMTNLYEILNERDIDGIAVYPYPQQLFYDTRKFTYFNKDFCKNKCSNFINYFDDFFDLVETEGLQEQY